MGVLTTEGDADIYENAVNPLQRVTVRHDDAPLDTLIATRGTRCSAVRRPNTGAHGDIERRMDWKPAALKSI
jgi:hypothetical protein